MDGWYMGNLLFGGFIGFLIVDPATGAMWKLDDNVYGNLSPDPEYKAATEPATPPNNLLPMPTAHQELTKSLIEKIKQLKELKDSGVLTDDEYESKRKALVDKL